MFIFTPTWGRFPFWRAYFSNELKPPTSQDIKRFCMSSSWMEEISPRLQICVPETFAGTHRCYFDKTIIRIPMFHNQFLKANFWPPKKKRVTKKMKPLEVGMSSIEPKCNSYLEPCYLGMSCVQPVSFFWGGGKKNDIWWQTQISSFQENIIQGLHSGIFFHVMFVQCVFPKKKSGGPPALSQEGWTDRCLLVKLHPGWCLLMCFFHSPFDDFGGLLGPGGLNLRPKRNTVHRNEGSTCVGLVAGTWWPVYLFF